MIKKVGTALGKFGLRTWDHAVGTASYGAGVAVGFGLVLSTIALGFEWGYKKAELDARKKDRHKAAESEEE